MSLAILPSSQHERLKCLEEFSQLGWIRKLQLVESGLNLSKVGLVYFIPYFVNIFLLFGLALTKTFVETIAFSWGKIICVKQMILPGQITKVIGTVG